MDPILKMTNVGISLQAMDTRFDVLSDVSLDVYPGEIVGVAGESGSGKSMTGRTLLNLLPEGAQVRGEIDFDGMDLRTLDARGWRELRGGKIAMVSQDPTASLHPMLTVGEQLTDHLRTHLKLKKAAAQTRARELLAQVRIADPDRALKSYPHQFSGGMRQRISIAIALAASPKLLIADEPTTALDVTVQAGILHLFRQLSRDLGLSVIFITHDLGVLAALADRTYIVYAGRIMETARTDELLGHARHPYAKALLQARPETAEGAGRAVLKPIPGQPVTASSAPAGCPFATRCPDRIDACSPLVPPLVQVPDHGRNGAPHLAACVVHAPSFPPETRDHGVPGSRPTLVTSEAKGLV